MIFVFESMYKVFKCCSNLSIHISKFTQMKLVLTLFFSLRENLFDSKVILNNGDGIL